MVYVLNGFDSFLDATMLKLQGRSKICWDSMTDADRESQHIASRSCFWMESIPVTHVANWFGGTQNSSKFIFWHLPHDPCSSPIRPQTLWHCTSQSGWHWRWSTPARQPRNKTERLHWPVVVTLCSVSSPNVPMSPSAIWRDLSFTAETDLDEMDWNEWNPGRRPASATRLMLSRLLPRSYNDVGEENDRCHLSRSTFEHQKQIMATFLQPTNRWWRDAKRQILTWKYPTVVEALCKASFPKVLIWNLQTKHKMPASHTQLKSAT